MEAAPSRRSALIVAASVKIASPANLRVSNERLHVSRPARILDDHGGVAEIGTVAHRRLYPYLRGDSADGACASREKSTCGRLTGSGISRKAFRMEYPGLSNPSRS